MNTIKTIWENANDLSNAVANLIVIESKKAISEKGLFTIALSGGNTPKILYDLLATPNFVNNINWNNTIIAFGDERFVPYNSDESNYKMVKETLLSKIKIPKKNILIVPTQNITPENASKKYELQLKQYINAKNNFDIILLGIGEEGHTASIFPKSPLLIDKKNIVSNIFVAEKNSTRISFTMPFINKSKNVVFLVSGENKKEIVKKIFSKNNAQFPAALVAPKQNLYWFLDKNVL